MPKEKIEEMKKAIKKSTQLSEEEKTQSVQHLENWIREDKAFGIVFSELVEMNATFKELFSEVGLV